MAEKRKLTDRALASLKPARAGQRYEVMDEVGHARSQLCIAARREC